MIWMKNMRFSSRHDDDKLSMLEMEGKVITSQQCCHFLKMPIRWKRCVIGRVSLITEPWYCVIFLHSANNLWSSMNKPLLISWCKNLIHPWFVQLLTFVHQRNTRKVKDGNVLSLKWWATWGWDKAVVIWWSKHFVLCLKSEGSQIEALSLKFFKKIFMSVICRNREDFIGRFCLNFLLYGIVFIIKQPTLVYVTKHS